MILSYVIISIIIAVLIFFNKNKSYNYLLLGIFLILQWAYTIYVFKNPKTIDFIFFTSDSLSIIFLAVLSVISVSSAYHSYIYFSKSRDVAKERSLYFCAYVILIMALSCAYLANHIAVTWIFVELTTLASSALIYHDRNERTLEATWKYIFVCSISITLVFIGILFLSIAVQEAKLNDLSYSALVANAKSFDTFWLKMAFLFIFTGYTAKSGLVPMYTAGIDAKDTAPSPASAIFSSCLMNVGFIGIFRFYEIIAQTSIISWANKVIYLSAILSIFVATVYMLKVKNFKRMMAYSSIEHMGIVMLGMASAGIGFFAAIYHLIMHSFTKAGLFYQIGQVYRVFKSKSVYDVGNYFKYNTTGALVLLLGFFCAIAMPPSGMFISEFLIFKSVIQAGNLWLLIIALLLITFIIWAFGKNILKLLFSNPVNFNDESVEKIKPVESLSQLILFICVIYIGIHPPDILINLINDAVVNLPH